MRPPSVAVFAVFLVLASLPGAPGHVGVNGTGWAAGWDPIGDIVNKIGEAFASALRWLADSVSGAFWGMVGPLLRALAKLVLGNPVPEYADWGPVDEVSWYEIRVPEMLGLYGKAKLVAYTLLPLPIVLGALSIGLEGFGLVREGEGMLMIKKSLWVAVLIPVSMTLYEYGVHLLSAVTHYLCPPDTLSWYLGISFGGVGLLAFIVDPLIFLFILVVAIAGATRILAVATLASILPVLLVLSLIPKINRVATMLIETLIALALVQLVAGAMISMAVAIASGIPDASLEDRLVKVMIAIASLTIPLIAPMFIGRSGFAAAAASALLGYTVYPAAQALRGQIMAGAVAAATHAPRPSPLGWGPRYIYRGAKALPRLPRMVKARYEDYRFKRHWDRDFYDIYYKRP